jgi:5-methylthioadenosine/S-adenosylhomocysteine deaminase
MTLCSAKLIDGAHLPNGNGFRPASVLVRGDRIAAVAWSDDDRQALATHAGETFDASGCWLIPGLIDAHAHAYAAILRGSENSLPLELWALFTVAYGKALDAEALRASIMLGAAERIRSGITGFVDHTPQVHLAETALAAHEASGLRVAYAAFLHDQSDYDLLALDLPNEIKSIAGSAPMLDAEAYAARFAEIHRVAQAGSGRVSVQLGPNAPQRCSPAARDLWRKLRDRHNVPVHTHLLETHAQAKYGRQRWDGGTVAEMARQDLLNGQLSVAHGIWTDDAERGLLARHNVTVIHNPASNLMLGSGLLPFAAYRDCGVAMALGTDSANTGGRHDMLGAMRLAMMLHRHPAIEPSAWPSAATVLAMATTNGARVLGRAADLGCIEAGCLADLVLLHRKDSGTLLLNETIEGMLLHAGSEQVAAVMIGGEWALRDGRILAFNEAAMLREATDAQAAIREHVGTLPAQIQTALPELARSLRGWQVGPTETNGGNG